jgi:acyl-CoA synthetase (AMP-forming)/AMP-acid ligase II
MGNDALNNFVSLAEAFQASSAADPDSVALRTVGEPIEITWRKYAERVQRVAAGLASVGVGRGDTVALMMTNRPEFNVCDTAALHLGAASFSVYNTSTPEQTSYLFKDSGNRVVICEAQFAKTVLASLDGTSVEHVLCIDGAPEGTVALDDLEAPAGFDFEAVWRSVEPGDVATLASRRVCPSAASIPRADSRWPPPWSALSQLACGAPTANPGSTSRAAASGSPNPMILPGCRIGEGDSHCAD